MIEQIERGDCEFSVAYIKDTLIDERPAVALAIFPLEQYTGTITTDLFAEDPHARLNFSLLAKYPRACGP